MNKQCNLNPESRSQFLQKETKTISDMRAVSYNSLWEADTVPQSGICGLARKNKLSSDDAGSSFFSREFKELGKG